MLQRKDRFRNHDAREEEKSNAGSSDDAGRKSRACAEKSAAEGVKHEHERDHGQRERNSRRERVLPGDQISRSDQPVMHRRFLEIANAVHVQDGRIAPLDHFPRDERVRRVGIIQQRRLRRVADVEISAASARSTRTQAVRVSGNRASLDSFQVGRV